MITPLLAVVATFLAGSTPSKTVEVGDNFLAPTKLTVDSGTRMTPTQMRLSVRVRSGN